MKKFICLFIVFTAFFSFLPAKTVNDVFKSDEVVFYGLDLTNVKLTGSDGFRDKREIVDKFFIAWNQLLYKEQSKYDIAKFFRKNVTYKLDMIEKLNIGVSTKDLVIETSFSMAPEDIEAAVKKYPIKEKDGLGLILVVENLNKFSESGTFYVVFFDIASRNVLVSEKVVGSAGGIGFRNYWAKVFYTGLKYAKDEFDTWENKYSK